MSDLSRTMRLAGMGNCQTATFIAQREASPASLPWPGNSLQDRPR